MDHLYTLQLICRIKGVHTSIFFNSALNVVFHSEDRNLLMRCCARIVACNAMQSDKVY